MTIGKNATTSEDIVQQAEMPGMERSTSCSGCARSSRPIATRAVIGSAIGGEGKAASAGESCLIALRASIALTPTQVLPSAATATSSSPRARPWAPIERTSRRAPCSLRNSGPRLGRPPHYRGLTRGSLAHPHRRFGVLHARLQVIALTVATMIGITGGVRVVATSHRRGRFGHKSAGAASNTCDGDRSARRQGVTCRYPRG
jgi:hypothetical protein